MVHGYFHRLWEVCHRDRGTPGSRLTMVKGGAVSGGLGLFRKLLEVSGKRREEGGERGVGNGMSRHGDSTGWVCEKEVLLVGGRAV